MATIEQMISRQAELNLKLAGEGWKEKDYLLAAIVETVELINWYPWKWWKKGKDANIVQAKIELVDIWHFLLSHFGAMEVEPQFFDEGCIGCNMEDPNIDIKDFLKSISESDPYRVNCGDVLYFFQSVILSLGFTLKEVLAIYDAKYNLNLLRNNYGYNDGSYVKEWQPGIEDNDVMMEMVDSYGNGDIYNELENYYLSKVIN